MRIFFLQILLISIWLPLAAQKNKAEITGTLNTGETLTAEYPKDVFVYSIVYDWFTSSDATGETDRKKVGSDKTYVLTDNDAGRFIYVEVKVSKFFGSTTTYMSDWYGPIKNSVPVINGVVAISGVVKSGNTVTANYVYSVNNYPESGTTFRWFLADNATGANSTQIGNSSSLNLTETMVDKYIRVEVVPRDNRGVSGKSYTSSWAGPVEKPAPPPNQPPVATMVKINGNPVVCKVITGQYTYSDSEQDVESGTTFRWLRAVGENDSPLAIAGANAQTYTITADDQGKYLYFEVTPGAASGITKGSPVMSNPTSLIQNLLPTVNFQGGANICEGTTTNLSLTFSGTPPFNLEYTNGSSNFNLNTSSNSYQLKVTSGGTYKGTKLTDNLNCPVTNLPSSSVVSIKPKPNLNFAVGNSCYTGDSTRFVNSSVTKTSITWNWSFGDNAASADKNKSSLEVPSHLYPASGSYRVTLIGANADGCRDTVIKNVKLGTRPQTAFTWDRECLNADHATRFQDVSVSSDKISQYKWTLRGGNSLISESSASSFTYKVPNTGTYEVKLKIGTELGCKDSLTRNMVVKPIFHLKDSFYYESFDLNNTTWNTSQGSENKWALGIPAGSVIKQAHSAPDAYYTNFTVQRSNQQMELSSSCFDFTEIVKPVIEMWINYNNQETKEGAVLQYVTDGETSWKNVGDLNSGTKWYNSNAIESKPGGQSNGWTGSSGGWVQARQSLIGLANQANVRFRMVYGSMAGAAGDGFAFDDVFIGQRDKKVLLEYFTNQSDAFSNQTNDVVDKLLNSAGSGVVGIQYHTSFPGQDSLNERNTANPAARVLYYGIGKVPSAVLDGCPDQQYAYDFTLNSPTVNDITKRSLEDPMFSLNIAANNIGGIITGAVKITALKQILNIPVTLNIAFVEDIGIQEGTSPRILRNVLRSLYPSSGGTVLASSWSKDQQRDVSFSWPVKNVTDVKNLKIVAFIQDNISREVYQVETGLANTITSDGPDLEKDSLKVTIYPNPAAGFAYLAFGRELHAQLNLKLFNTQGKICKEALILRNVSVFNLNLEGLIPGVYFMKLTDNKSDTKILKLVIGNK